MQIKLDANAFPVYPLVKCAPKGGNWNVLDVELYADAAHTKLIADDVWKALDADQRADIYRRLDAHEERTRELSRELIEIMRPVQL